MHDATTCKVVMVDVYTALVNFWEQSVMRSMKWFPLSVLGGNPKMFSATASSSWPVAG